MRNHHEAAAADISRFGEGDGKRKSDGDRRIDRVAAFAQHLDAGRARELAVARNHRVGRDGRRPAFGEAPAGGKGDGAAGSVGDGRCGGRCLWGRRRGRAMRSPAWHPLSAQQCRESCRDAHDGLQVCARGPRPAIVRFPCGVRFIVR